MDFSAELNAFDDKKPDAASEGEAGQAHGKGEFAALTPFGSKTPSGSARKEAPPPKIEPIPSSALVVLPPKKEKEKFDARFSAGERLGGPAGGKRNSWSSYGLPAAALLLIGGGAYALGNHYLSIPGLGASPAAPSGAPVAAISSSPVSAAPAADLAELSRDAKALSDQVHKLQARLASLQAQTPDEIRGLRKSLDSLRADLDAAKADSKTQIAALSAKLDRIHESTTHVSAADKLTRLDAKAIQATLDRAARGEGAAGDVTGSIPASRAAPVTLASVETPHHAPQLLNDWVVRDVYRGIALVEGPQGAMEVVPGDTLPGAGTVRAIERRGVGWIVLTSRGYVDFDHD